MAVRDERNPRGSRGRADLPLEVRRALWRKVWDVLLAPADLRDPDEIPAHERKDVRPERDCRGGMA